LKAQYDQHIQLCPMRWCFLKSA